MSVGYWVIIYEYTIIICVPFTVNVYIPNLNKHDLYYEEFKMVSIMFASLKNVELNLSSLRFLNEVITEFDKIVS